MKKNTLFLGFALMALLFASCEADDTSDIVININGAGAGAEIENEIGGTLSADLELDADTTYDLTSALIVEEGFTLTMNPGTVVRATPGADVYIAVKQGGKINAEGTSTNPVVLTSSNTTPNAGDWGGLILLGRAPINSVAGGDATSTSEIGGLPYGGSISDDDSGVLRYLRVEYSGGAADASSENNGFSFYGVGNGTTVAYIQAFEGKDDGVEFFGGTVNASFVAVSGAQDDSVDWTEGYTGTLNNVYILHGIEHDKGIEADGFNSDIGNNSNPLYFSKPTVSNVTIIGRGSTASSTPEAIRLRVGTQGIFTNILLQGFDEGFDLDGDMGDSPTGQGVIDGDLSVTDVTFIDVTTKLKNDTEFTFDESDFIIGDGNATGTDFNTWGSGWTRN